MLQINKLYTNLFRLKTHSVFSFCLCELGEGVFWPWLVSSRNNTWNHKYHLKYFVFVLFFCYNIIMNENDAIMEKESVRVFDTF